MRQSTLPLTEKRSQVRSQPAAVDLAVLRAGETRYRELFDHLHSGVVVYEATAGGADFIIRDFNPAAARLEQTTPQAVIGRPVTEAFPGVAEFGLLEVLRRVWKTGRAQHHPISLYRDERLASWRENYVYRLPLGEVVVVYDDVTERKRAEELLAKYRLLAAEARDVMFFVRAVDGAIVEANLAAEEAYGYSREELLHLDIDTLRPASEGAGIDERIEAAGTAGALFETEHRRKDGSLFPVEVSVRGTVLVDGDEVHLSVVRDISERKQAEEALRRSEERYRILTEASPDFIYIIDRHDRVQYVNSKGAAAVGRSPEEIVGLSRADLFDAETAAHMEATLKRVFESGEAEESESQLIYPTGQAWITTWLVPIKDDTGQVGAAFGVSRDITERKRAERELRQSEEKFAAAFHASPDLMAITRMSDGTIVEVNEAYSSLLGYSRAESLGKTTADLSIWADPADRATFMASLEESGQITDFETTLRRRDGTLLTCIGSARTLDVVGERCVLSVIHDVSECKQAERALRESEQRLTLAKEAAGLGVFDFDLPSGVHRWDARTRELWGVAPDEPISSEALMASVHPDDREGLRAAMEGRFKDQENPAYEAEYRVITPADGIERWVSVSGTAFFEDERPVRTVGIVQDVTERKRAAEALTESERRFRSLFEDSPVAIWEEDHSAVKAFLEQLVASGVDDVAGYLRERRDEYQHCLKLARALDANHAAAALFEAASREELIGRQDELYPRGEVGGLPDFWAAMLAGQRSASYEEGNFTLTGRQLQILETASVARGHEESYDRVYVADVDVTERRRAEQALLESTVQLRLTLKAAVAALGATTEMRDPYTAGHQRRVAELASAIATELGWDEARIETLRTAALLHDLGKIVVPAKILAKPGRLSEIEMNLIRQHAAAGAETVADIDFEGAIAEMIRQHHERLDGSGYPAGLKGSEILPEARILAVADVVEAMISHRPYRAALPLEEALAEIEAGAGIRYDAKSAEACVRLFREKGFALSE
jgi:PAS domain S-box-containing protein/putative nucleotidyltransferase with HDIG domain